MQTALTQTEGTLGCPSNLGCDEEEKTLPPQGLEFPHL